MPAFFESEFWSLANPELWVAIGLAIFLAILWMAGAFKMAAASLDAQAGKIKTDLDEAARLRAEAEALLADINRQRVEADAQAKSMLAAAEDQAKRMAADAKAKLEETIALRTRLAEQKIANAQAEATAEVRAAAIDLAAGAAERVLAAQLAETKADPMVDRAIGQLATRLQ